MASIELSTSDQAEELYDMIALDPIASGGIRRSKYKYSYDPLSGPKHIRNVPDRVKRHFPSPRESAVWHGIVSGVEHDYYTNSPRSVGRIATAAFRQYEGISRERVDISVVSYHVTTDGLGHYGLERHFDTELGGPARSAQNLKENKEFEEFLATAEPWKILAQAKNRAENYDRARELGLATNVFDVDREEAQQVIDFHRTY